MGNKNSACIKILSALLLLLLTACTSYAADAVPAPAVLAAPTPMGDVAIPDAPSTPQPGMDIPVGTINPGPQNYTDTPANSYQDVTTDGFTPDTPATTGNNTQTQPLDQQLDVDTPINETEINNYFEDILNSRNASNPVGALFGRLPRFGMSFFRRPPSTYAPVDRVPVAQDYRITVGDQMTLTIWGIPEEGNFNFTINRDGMATIPHIGTVRLAGYTFSEAERILHARLGQYYTGFQMNLSMGRLSSLLVYVTGNARRPGAYTVSSFSTLVNALISSGGPSANGTLRKIELKRAGRTVAVFDMYAMLLHGDKTQDVRLQDGDVIYIPPVGPLVGLAGEVHMPGVYELNGATRVQDLLYIAGGLNARTFRGRIQFYRIFDHAYAGAFEGSLADIENTELKDGDILRLYPVISFASSVLITGPLLRPGRYAIIPGRTRFSEILERAGGLGVTASDKAEITRVTPTIDGPVNERFTVSLTQVMQRNPEHDIVLEQNDQITVLVIPNWKQQIRVTIAGEVVNPGSYSMFVGERLSDLINRAGGFTPKAYLRGAMFTRRSVAAEQRRSLNQMADRMERELLEASQNTAGTENTGALQQEFNRRRQLISNLRHLDIMGRIITKIDTPKNIAGTVWDYELQDGDYLGIPQTPLTVHVLGAVYTSSTQLYRPEMGINAYISAAGGALRSAHKRMVYLLKADGTTLRLTRSTAMLSSKQWTPPRGYSAKVEPGDTIVVPVKYMDRQGIESFKDAVDIIYKIAVAAGVIINATD
ncbi:MAG: SLBB domain-containing protein [Synergistaceae bacterium]|nr:SLBB domain-containing protein [Synergistaceae bacterium]